MTRKDLFGTLDAGVVSPCASTGLYPGLEGGTLNLAEKVPEASAFTDPGDEPVVVAPRGVKTTEAPAKVTVMLSSLGAKPVPVTVTQIPEGPEIG
jgi:hypothetical protein